MARIVARLGGASSGAGQNTIVVALRRAEAEELVAHIRVRLGHRVQRSIDGTSESKWASETSLRWGSRGLVVAVRAGNNDLEVICEISISLFLSLRRCSYLWIHRCL